MVAVTQIPYNHPHMEPIKFAYESMGTHWAVTIWDPIDPAVFGDLKSSVIAQSQEFDQTYSRFIKTSLVWQLTEKRGVVEVPADLVVMLRLYEKLYRLSVGKFTPLVGFALNDMGYDAEYSISAKATIRPVPKLEEVIRIVDDTHIELMQSALIDIGALGKGFFVDRISAFLRSRGIKRFLVDGSGDIYYSGDGQAIRAGLEHPDDPAKAIGVIEMKDGAMCASGSNRRRWSTYHHIIDPVTLTSTKDILATWVLAENAVLADGLATCLFLCEPENFAKELQFEYCMLNEEYRVKRSLGFEAELF